MALVLEYERRRRYPILLFEQVAGHDIPIVCNVVASRRALAFALGRRRARRRRASTRAASRTTSSRSSWPIRRSAIACSPGLTLDLARLPIPRYFPATPARYLTAGMLVARDPETGVETEGYHRFQLKGRDRMGVSLHSRRRMFEYQRRAEAAGSALPCAIVLGLHPLVSMGSLAYPPADVGKFEVVGGLLGEPLQVAPCATIDLHVPGVAPRSSSRARSCPACASPRARSASSPATSRAARPSTSSWPRPSRCASARGSSRSAPAAPAITSPRSASIREAEIANALGRVIPNVTRRARAALGHVVVHRLRRPSRRAARARPST